MRHALRIFQILEFNQFNTGSVHQMFQAAVGLRERGHDVTIVSRPDALLKEKSEAHGVTFFGLSMRSQFDPAKWDRRAFRREKQILDDSFLIAQVGVRDWKGWKELIDAVAEVSHRQARVHLALIGCRNDEELAGVRTYARGRVRLSAIEY